MKNKITMRQAGILIMMTTFSNKILLLPALMHEYIKADAIFAVILLFSLEFFALPIFLKLKKAYPDSKLNDILSKYITVIGAKLVYIAILIFMLMKALLTFSIVYVYFKEQIYQGEFIGIALITFLPIMNHAVISGLKPTARTIELFFSTILLGFLFCLFISFFTSLSMPFFFVSPASKIFMSVYRYAFTFSDLLFIYLVIEKLDYKKEEEKQIYFYTILGMLLVLSLFILFYAKYQTTSFMHNNALADLLVFSVDFNAIGRLDIVAMITIMLTTLLQMELYCYGFCDSLLNIFPLLSKKYAVVVFDVVFLILYYIFIGKYEVMVSVTVKVLPVLGVLLGYAFPILCFFISLFKRRINEKEDS